MSPASHRVLVIGYGNPGRLDDGLGPRLARALEALDLPGVRVDSDYQLQVEDASDVAAHDVVVFVDAHVSCAPPYEFRRVPARPVTSFSSHSLSPEALLAMAREYFGATTRGYVLAVRGYEFNEFGERLSPRAQENLQAATAFLGERLRSRSFDHLGCDAPGIVGAAPRA